MNAKLSPLERMAEKHKSSCTMFRFSDGANRRCSCGRDKAAAELERLRRIEAAARELVSRMRAIYESPEYEAVWQLWHVHNGMYKGPQWVNEVETLDAALNETEPK